VKCVALALRAVETLVTLGAGLGRSGACSLAIGRLGRQWRASRCWSPGRPPGDSARRTQTKIRAQPAADGGPAHAQRQAAPVKPEFIYS
jgi:hypothetical protein